MSRPLIGVSVSKRTGWRVFPLIAFNVWITGGRAVRWDATRDFDLDAVDGVIIGGGDDVGPELYGGKLGISARLDPARDRFEMTLAESALGQNIPVLGICRGSQMLNVALGGTLDQDAWTTFSAARKITTILPKREICIEENTRLAQLSGEAPMMVNALHSQAVNVLGHGLRVAARDTHGMIQAIERVRDPFALGVQWHPEHLFYAHRQRAIFRALVNAARAYANDRQQLRAACADAQYA
ncbi:gamma-glutamyl-gamma-aminobutyrate hydrolase family protein [Marivita sp. S6314]|uniref:gamma-glutamyl-gamma-aminobutyrate hydrolase family protein n=1 Tax=Marivita sp. S6314 TaxID=2926406 RepID=UPI001FF13D08|nr:gamma-glutamyl-gamma-aminobutyrate hydrolase family protein [Marivita sp. S6314]MCK0149505.1 gamma-glutamyl-gamma-aminobutyrate hydrolase family protein [Marivita sp. S6314]